MMALHFRPWEEGLTAIPLPDARELSDEVLEALRLRALRGCELVFTEAEVADLLSVCRETVWTLSPVCEWGTPWARVAPSSTSRLTIPSGCCAPITPRSWAFLSSGDTNNPK